MALIALRNGKLKEEFPLTGRQLSLKELNDILRKFDAEVKTKQGRTLSPSALTGIRAAVHRFITSPPNN